MGELTGLLKVALLSPAAFVGALVGMAFMIELKTVREMASYGALLGIAHLPVIAVLAWTFRRPGEFLGHSWTLWCILVSGAYLTGLASVLVFVFGVIK